MSDNEKSPQSIRLDQFRQKTGYTITQFSTQCGIPSPSTMHKIISEGKTPSPKILKKIITRFPELNHDWVVLGYGEMIVKGLQTQETSAKSLEISAQSTYQYIIQALRDHDFALNELSKSLNKTVDLIDRSTKDTTERARIFTSVQQANAVDFFDNLQTKINGFETFLKNEIEKFKLLEDASRVEIRSYIDKLDKQRTAKNEADYKKLSQKIHSYLEDTRNKQEQLIEKQLELGIQKLSKEMHKNAVAQTDFAIKSLLDKFSVKRLMPSLGKPTKVSNPKPSE